VRDGTEGARPGHTPWVCCGTRRVPVPRADAFEPPARHLALEDEAWAVSCALHEPIGAPPLVAQVREALAAAPHGEVVIAIPDASRPCPSPVVLDQLLAELAHARVHKDRIVIAIGCGLHATTSEDEKRTLVGPAVAAKVEVVDAQGIETRTTDLGETSLGTPVLIARRVAEAAFVIGVGVVEPHLYAGFSGGVKAVAIGCAGEPTIAWTHRPAFISEPGVLLGQLQGNPFHETLREIAARTPLRAVVNVVVDEHGSVVSTAAGEPVATQASLARAHRAAWLRPASERYDVIVAGVPHPKSDSLYQASRAATYLALQAAPALADGGLIVLCADLPHGAGQGPGERNHARILAAASPAAVIERGLREPLGPGGQRAFVMARVLERYRVAVAGDGDAALLERLGIESYRDIEDAIRAAEARLGRRARVLAIADALTTVVHLA
jgi:lactate racemase